MAKKYYWLKLKNDFFTNKKIKKLRKIAGGDTYTIIYLKMQLLSITNEGKLYFDNVEDSFAEELALELDEDVENVKVTLLFLIKNELIVEVNPEEYMLPEAMKCIGSETDKAELMRKKRAKEKMQIGNNVTEALPCVTKSYTEIEKEKEKDIELDKEKEKKERKKSYGEYKNVKLLEKEYQSLVSDYGSSLAEEIIKYLDEYIEMKGTKYKSCYMAIRKWVVQAVTEKKKQPNKQKGFVREEIVPDWFNKDNETTTLTEEEQNEANEILESIDPDFQSRKEKLQEKLRNKYGKNASNEE